MKTRVHTKIKLISLIVFAVMLFSTALSLFLFPGNLASADMTATVYSNVFDDLSSADNFDIGLYPSNSSDTSIYVIQIAESSDEELFIYTYQPCQRSNALTATKVNLALSSDVSNTKLYSLKLLSQQGVFCKYLVEDLVVDKSKATRYYNITSIYRKWLSGIDNDVDNDNTVEDVAFGVGQSWSVWSTSDDNVRYDMHEEEYINVTSQMVGVKRYYDGFGWDANKSCDAHYLAFNCDHAIDKLLSATVEFDSTAYRSRAGSSLSSEDPVHHSVNLYDYQVASNDGSGWFGKREEWHRVTSVNAFSQEVELTNEEKSLLSDYTWILNFYESEFYSEAGSKDILISGLLPFGFIWTIINSLTTNGEYVSNVSLLRMEFEYAGEIYNLGVVANSQTGSGIPINKGSGSSFDLLSWLYDHTGVPSWVWICGIVLVVLAILMPILSAVFPAFRDMLVTILKGLANVIKYVFKGIVWLISLPFKLISAIIAKVKDRG